MAVSLHFDRPGRPLIVAVEDNLEFQVHFPLDYHSSKLISLQAEFVLATLDEPEPAAAHQVWRIVILQNNPTLSSAQSLPNANTNSCHPSSAQIDSNPSRVANTSACTVGKRQTIFNSATTTERERNSPPLQLILLIHPSTNNVVQK